MKFRYFFPMILGIAIPLDFVIGETKIADPDWTFQDDFEGSEDRTFWASAAAATHGVDCSSDNSYDSKVLRFDYPEVGTVQNGHSWSEKRLNMPASQQFEMTYNIFVPSNYVPAAGNHKNFVFWSGPYGKAAANVSISSENWPYENKSRPSVYIGVDGTNYDHSKVASNAPTMFPPNFGQWQRVHVYLELATHEGDSGVFEVYRNGELITGTNHHDIKQAYGKPHPSEQIEYSSRGNFIDQGYLMGWANKGLPEDTTFCIDNFIIKGRFTVGETFQESDAYLPLPPSNLSVSSVYK